MAFKLIIKRSEMTKGAITFGVFDTIAALILGEFIWLRLIAMTFIGGSIYAVEIPSYFAWLENKSQTMKTNSAKWFKTLMTAIYFNPLWIARHIFFINLFTNQTISSEILSIAFQSFIYGFVISFACNYIIQNQVPLLHRFLASSLFSGCMAVYYALSSYIFL